MKRKFNYTGRKKIERGRVSINLIRQNGSVVAFALNKLDIDDMDLAPQATIHIEAYYRTELKRFDFGTVGSRSYPPSCSLDGLAYPENLKFRILIVNPSDGKVLAHAVGITPEEPAEKKSILPVEFRDLGNEIWRVEYEGDGGAPILCINNRIPNSENMAKNDPQFFIYVYPAVIREILTHMVFVDGVDSVTEPLVDWHDDWLRFSMNLDARRPATLNPEDDNFEKKESFKWIENVVEKFCNRYHSEFQKYLQKLEENP